MVRLPDNRGDDGKEHEAPSLAALSQEVKELVRLISTTDISELHLESGAVRITIKRGAAAAQMGAVAYPAPVYTPPATLPEPQSAGLLNMIGNRPAHGEDIAVDEGEELVVAPMVGTFYAAPAPTEPPYVSEGEVVEPGQTLGIIEAMKMMNPIESDFAGRITKILVQNAQPVEYGQPLMVIATT